MIEQETIEKARQWCDTGAKWIDSGAFRLGLSHLDRAITIFAESEDVNWLTYARHQKLRALFMSKNEDQVENLQEEIMRGYFLLDDAYGKALLLSHMAEELARQGRKERAMVNLNLAVATAEAAGLGKFHAHLLAEQAHLFMERENPLRALRFYRRAEEVAQKEGLQESAAHSRYLIAEALARLGENKEAAAWLEDLQTRLLRAKRFQEALEPLRLLGRLYEESGLVEEKTRVSQLMYYCGQNVIQSEGSHRFDQPEARRPAPIRKEV